MSNSLKKYEKKYKDLTNEQLADAIPEEVRPLVVEYINRLCIDDPQFPGSVLELSEMKAEILSLRKQVFIFQKELE